ELLQRAEADFDLFVAGVKLHFAGDIAVTAMLRHRGAESDEDFTIKIMKIVALGYKQAIIAIDAITLTTCGTDLDEQVTRRSGHNANLTSRLASPIMILLRKWGRQASTGAVTFVAMHAGPSLWGPLSNLRETQMRTLTS